MKVMVLCRRLEHGSSKAREQQLYGKQQLSQQLQQQQQQRRRQQQQQQQQLGHRQLVDF